MNLSPKTYRLKPPSQRGAIAVYMALVIVVILISSAMVFSSILTRQVRESQEVVSSERAFYAANSALEEGLWVIGRTSDTAFNGQGAIPYESNTEAPYEVKAKSIEGAFPGQRFPCVVSRGVHKDEARRLATGPPSCDLLQ